MDTGRELEEAMRELEAKLSQLRRLMADARLPFGVAEEAEAWAGGLLQSIRLTDTLASQLRRVLLGDLAPNPSASQEAPSPVAPLSPPSTVTDIEAELARVFGAETVPPKTEEFLDELAEQWEQVIEQEEKANRESDVRAEQLAALELKAEEELKELERRIARLREYNRSEHWLLDESMVEREQKAQQIREKAKGIGQIEDYAADPFSPAGRMRLMEERAKRFPGLRTALNDLWLMIERQTELENQLKVAETPESADEPIVEIDDLAQIRKALQVFNTRVEKALDEFETKLGDLESRPGGEEPLGGAAVGARPKPKPPTLVPSNARTIEEAKQPPRNP